MRRSASSWAPVGSARETSSANSRRFAGALLAADGSLETTFVTDGTVQVDIAPEQADEAAAVSSRGNGFVLAGRATIDGERRFAVFGLTVDGQPDPGFTSDGPTKTIAVFGVADQAFAVTISATTAVVLAGEAFDPDALNGPVQLAAVRLAESELIFGSGFEAGEGTR